MQTNTLGRTHQQQHSATQLTRTLSVQIKTMAAAQKVAESAESASGRLDKHNNRCSRVQPESWPRRRHVLHLHHFNICVDENSPNRPTIVIFIFPCYLCKYISLNWRKSLPPKSLSLSLHAICAREGVRISPTSVALNWYSASAIRGELLLFIWEFWWERELPKRHFCISSRRRTRLKGLYICSTIEINCWSFKAHFFWIADFQQEYS